MRTISLPVQPQKHGRQIALARRAGDSGDGGDSDIGIPLLLSLTLKAV